VELVGYPKSKYKQIKKQKLKRDNVNIYKKFYPRIKPKGKINYPKR